MCKLNFVDCYFYYVNIYFHLVYFDFVIVLDSIAYYYYYYYYYQHCYYYCTLVLELRIEGPCTEGYCQIQI